MSGKVELDLSGLMPGLAMPCEDEMRSETSGVSNQGADVVCGALLSSGGPCPYGMAMCGEGCPVEGETKEQ